MSRKRMSPENPYEPSEASEFVRATRRRSELFWLRVVLYAHIAGVVGCTLFTLQDTQYLRVAPSVSWLIVALAVPAMSTASLCPIAMAVAASRLRNRSVGFRLSIVAGDVVLSLFQFWVLLPTVQ